MAAATSSSLLGPDGAPSGAAATGAPRIAATAVGALKKALIDEGVHSFVRAPYLHTAPPLIISEEELRDGFGRIDRALDAFDDALGL